MINLQPLQQDCEKGPTRKDYNKKLSSSTLAMIAEDKGIMEEEPQTFQEAWNIWMLSLDKNGWIPLRRNSTT